MDFWNRLANLPPGTTLNAMVNKFCIAYDNLNKLDSNSIITTLILQKCPKHILDMSTEELKNHVFNEMIRFNIKNTEITYVVANP